MRIPAGRLHELSGLRQLSGQYANDGADMILDDTPQLSFHAIMEDDRLVGMFKLDPLYPERHRFARSDDLGLRGVLIDLHHQGRGIGTRAMTALPAHAARSYPDKRRILLTVNLLNPAAYAAYRRAGFQDDGDIYGGGSRGPQHILWASLPPASNSEASCSAKSSQLSAR